jgi:hypothetical protein
VLNQGTISGPQWAVRLLGGGYADNVAGQIAGGAYGGVYIGGALGTVTNTGTISGTGSGEGVRLRSGGVVTNNAGLIEGYDGVYFGFEAAGTVTQAEGVDRLEYFHIELASHDVVLADGAPAETFVDCDNRLMFQNGSAFAALYPDDLPVRWEFCAPRMEPGAAELIAIRAALLGRAAALGHALTDDPDLHLIVDGRYRFTIPGGSVAVWFASRSTVPAEIEAASRDIRQLGVAVEHIALRDVDLSIEVWHGHATLCEGFHGDEAAHRWTDGMARLPETWLHRFPGAFALDVHLAPRGLAYQLPAQPLAAAA